MWMRAIAAVSVARAGRTIVITDQYTVVSRPTHDYNAAMRESAAGTRIGIIGGGQLGRMMILAGKPLGFCFGVVTPSGDDPAVSLADRWFPGALDDARAIGELVAWSDVTTYEIEHIDVRALVAAEAAGGALAPRPAVLELIQDKLKQKRHLERAGVPIPAILDAPDPYPVVQKLRFGGYDGRGVVVLRSDTDDRLPGATYYERCVEFDRELAVIVARSTRGESSVYPVVDTEFDPAASICSRTAIPASIPDALAERAQAVALNAVAAIDATGIVAVELFVTTDREVLVNEIAPRPHNSGHLTIECCETSQFEQHLRAVLGLPLGSVRLLTPGVMLNLLGSAGAVGTPFLPFQTELLAEPGVHLHLYGKSAVRPYRKMGHVTITAAVRDDADRVADRVAQYAVVEGRGERE